jgi:hypothetical protein
MDIPANNAAAAHGKNHLFRWDTSTQLALTLGIALLIAILLHVKFKGAVGVSVGK